MSSHARYCPARAVSPAGRWGAEPLERRALLAALVVNSALDNATPGDSLVTLREAITAANTDTTTDTGQTGSGADTITFALSPGAHSINLTSALPAMSTELDIDGSGAALLTVRRDTGGYRVLTVVQGGEVRLSGMTVADGILGGILNSGTLSVTDCTLRNNTDNTFASVGGGAIHNTGALVIERSTIRDNEAFGEGGGIFNAASGSLRVVDSTFEGNRVDGGVLGPGHGGGIYSVGTLDVVNSTFTQNHADSIGGAIYSRHTADVDHCTITGNTAGSGGAAIRNQSGSLTLDNSVVALNSASSGISGPFAGADNFLVGDPMLGALADNGGPTPTMRPMPGSPLIDAGDPDFVGPPQFDQRGPGFARVSGGRIDIGAVEIDAVAPIVTSSEFAFLTAPQALRFAFSESVAATLDAADLLLENLTTGSMIPAANVALAYDTSSDTATLTFPGYAYGALPNGSYRATLRAADVTDPSGNPLPGDHVVTFFFLNGDATRDGRVDLDDFSALAANFGRTGTNFTEADFTYDGRTDLADFNLLAARFGHAISAPSATGLDERVPDSRSDHTGWRDDVLR
jgi:predicted outer membrane repeat protein